MLVPCGFQSCSHYARPLAACLPNSLIRVDRLCCGTSLAVSIFSSASDPVAVCQMAEDDEVVSEDEDSGHLSDPEEELCVQLKSEEEEKRPFF